jgi:RNA polymerase sigma-70 factor (ECF subfamily)
MEATTTTDALQRVRRAVLVHDGAGLTDGRLLDLFIDHRDDAAFAAIVRRHGPMVWGVCHRLLDRHDAEDAFQATFLVLVRKAATVRPRERVGNWLYGVARQTALLASRTAARRRGRERQVVDVPEPAVTDQDRWGDLRPLLDDELTRLPDKYRAVVVLCDLEGRTRTEVARQLGVPEGSVAGWLARARGMLAGRLARRGVSLSAGALAAAISQNVASAGVPTSAVSSTIQAAALVAAGPAAASGVIPTKVAALTEGVLNAMLVSKLKAVTAVLLVVLACVGGGVVAARPSAAGQPPPTPDKKGKDEKKAPTAKQPSAGKNILRNGGFEEGDKTPAHWSRGNEVEGVEYVWDKKAGQKGTAGVCLHKTANRYFPIAQWYQVVDRTGDQPALRVTAQVKAEGVTKAVIDVVFLDGQGEATHKWAAYVGAKEAGDPAVSHDWKEYSGRVEIPPGTKKLQVGLQIYGPGKVWFDEVRAEYEK